MRGISHQKRNIVCAIDEHGKTVIQVSEAGRIHAKTLIEIYQNKVPSDCTVISDSHRSYHQLMAELGVKWIKIPSGKKEYKGYDLTPVNRLHSNIHQFLGRYRGVADKYLTGYIGLFKLLYRNKRWHLTDIFRSLFKKIVNSQCALKFKDFTGDFSFCWN